MEKLKRVKTIATAIEELSYIGAVLDVLCNEEGKKDSMAYGAANDYMVELREFLEGELERAVQE